MSDQLPVPHQPQLPAAPVTLSREERLDAYRAGISQTAAALRELGFVTHYEAEHTVSMEYRGYLFDFRIQKPGQVAHITSRPGGRPNKPNVSIYKLSDEVKSEFALQMMIGKEFSARPIFVALDESLPDPAAHIKQAVMGFLSSLNEAEHKLGKATVGLLDSPFKAEPLPDWLQIK